MATIHDVAKSAGVSAKTVSRVLNGDAPVNVKTREKIEAAMAELGYVPSVAARMMRSNKSGIVGLITGAISGAEADGKPGGLPDLPILQGIQQVMASSGKTLMIADTGGRADAVSGLIRTFLQYRVEGLIYVAKHHQKVDLPPIPTGQKLVLANCFDDAGTPAVLPDDRAGQRDLVADIIRAGHRRIGYLALPVELLADKLRRSGYRDALEAAGLPFDPDLVRTAEAEWREGETAELEQAIDHMLSLANPPTVLCCGNDKLAMQTYGILRSRGIEVPGQMSIAGFDNYRLISESLYPPLTTAELPYLALGEAAARRLLSMLSNDDAVPEDPTLVYGPVFWRSSVLPIDADDTN
ncbi:LacI family DNA-binding transcriptional regulator [Tropicimonas marinistellae]|uniref:LacI family DNA-binding transcriptional regulator n=1 Tax=Tropicimonas marinistellae TaxID=1739787 RepID=UPI00082FE7D5|nr:LacI family DNA-binding transcriptional regulator [Tropicimonas marinistellae]